MKDPSSYPDIQYHFVLKRFSTTAITIVMLITLSVLIGWAGNVAFLKGVLPGLATMKPLTAFCLLLAAIALWLQQPKESKNRIHHHLSLICAGLSMLIGAIMLLEYVTEADLGIDLWLFRQSVLAEDGIYPGRSSAITAFCFLGLGLSLLTLNSKPIWLTSLSTLLVLLISLVALIGYLYSSTALYEIGPFSSIALHTAFSFALLTLSILAIQSERPPTSVLTSRLLGSLMARRLIPVAIVFPILLGWLHLLDLQFGWFNLEFGLTVFTVSNILIIVSLIYITARLTNGSDVKRRQSAHIIHENEAQLASIIQSAMDAIITIDNHYNIVLFNDAAEKMFGRAAGQLIGRPLDHLIPIRYREIHSHHMQQFAKSGVSPRMMGDSLPLFGLRASDEEFPIEASISQIEVNGRQLFTVIVRDITQRIGAEARVEYQAQLLNQINDAVIATDTQFQITSWNHAAERTYGWQANEVIGQPLPQLLLTEYVDNDKESVMQEFQANGRWRGEVWQSHKDGHKIPIQASVVLMRNKIGQPMGAVSVNRSLKRIKHIEDQYQTLFTRAPVMYVVTQHQLGQAYIANCNDNFVELLGYTYKDVLGRPLADFYSLSSRMALEEKGGYQRALEGNFISEERQLVAKDGRIFETLLRAYPEKNLEGEVVGTLAIFMDITVRKKVETRLRELNTHLKSLNDVRSRLVDDISHEFRTPLANIALYTTLLTKKPEQLEKYTSILKEQVARMNRLMEVIITYAKLPPTIEELDREQININKIVTYVVDDKLLAAQSKDIELTTDLAADLPAFYCAPDLLKLCLDYLLNNAIIYTTKGSVKVSSFIQDSRLCVGFEDTGIGIAEHELLLIFERFYRCEAVGSLNIPGVGIGLSICQEIAILHGGEILVESVLGQGSMFTLCLPIVWT